MASNLASNNAYDFVEQPPQVFFCPVSFAVLLEPYQTLCCGNHLSQEVYQRLHGQPCPVCREENFTALDDKFHKRNVLALKVRCPHKAEACKWEGELGSLEQHLNTNSFAGECRYVDVDCPYACGERVQRRNVEEHKSQHCPLRPFTCQYCNHEATHQKITVEHWLVCEKYPLPCPNECGEEEIERQHLKEHLEQTCPLEEIKCEFSYAGCGAELQRRIMSAHMKEGMEAHLSLVSKKVPELEKVVQQLIDQIKQQENLIKQQEHKLKQHGDQIKQQGDRIKQQGDRIKQQEDQICTLTKPQVPPVDILMDDFEQHKKNNVVWYSPPFCSHTRGYKMCLKVYANGIGEGKGTHVSVFACLMKGEFDDHLKWPFSGRVTIQLKKKFFPHHHQETINLYNVPREYVCKPTEARNNTLWGKPKYISHGDLYYARVFPSNNQLLFRVINIVVMSK